MVIVIALFLFWLALNGRFGAYTKLITTPGSDWANLKNALPSLSNQGSLSGNAVPNAPGQMTPAGSKDNGNGTVTAPNGQTMTPGLDFGQILQKFGIGGTSRLPATGSTGSTGSTSGVGS